tara:strand:- start:1637 stop:2254 length:618 start_codon:yes stop_codon:yes gene_type:complete
MKKLITLLLVLVSVSSYSQSKREVYSYYEEICLNTEWGGSTYPSKFEKDVKIYVDGNISHPLTVELNKIVKELNDLIDPIDISIVNDSSESNVYLFFGNGDDFVSNLKYSQSRKDRLSKTLKSLDGYFTFRTSKETGLIKHSKIYIDVETTTVKIQRHALREELTQCLGFTNDSYMSDNSIFYQLNSEVTEYSKIDKDIIKLHYN